LNTVIAGESFGERLTSRVPAAGAEPIYDASRAGNICVLFTANDLYMRDYKIFAPSDCIVSNTAADNDHALRQIETVLKGNVAQSGRLAFQPSRGSRTAKRR
jgi:hypothetical protein